MPTVIYSFNPARWSGGSNWEDSMLRDKSFKAGPGPVTESILASPGIEGGAGSNPPVAAPNVGAMGAVAGSPFNSRAEAAQAVKTADLLLVIALFLIMIGGYHVHFMLTAGDWDFWIDWKDRRFWPTVLPIMLITFVAAAQYFFWENFRLPFGATFVLSLIHISEPTRRTPISY